MRSRSALRARAVPLLEGAAAAADAAASAARLVASSSRPTFLPVPSAQDEDAIRARAKARALATTVRLGELPADVAGRASAPHASLRQPVGPQRADKPTPAYYSVLAGRSADAVAAPPSAAAETLSSVAAAASSFVVSSSLTTAPKATMRNHHTLSSECAAPPPSNIRAHSTSFYAPSTPPGRVHPEFNPPPQFSCASSPLPPAQWRASPLALSGSVLPVRFTSSPAHAPQAPAQERAHVGNSSRISLDDIASNEWLIDSTPSGVGASFSSAASPIERGRGGAAFSAAVLPSSSRALLNQLSSLVDQSRALREEMRVGTRKSDVA